MLRKGRKLRRAYNEHVGTILQISKCDIIPKTRRPKSRQRERWRQSPGFQTSNEMNIRVEKKRMPTTRGLTRKLREFCCYIDQILQYFKETVHLLWKNQWNTQNYIKRCSHNKWYTNVIKTIQKLYLSTWHLLDVGLGITKICLKFIWFKVEFLEKYLHLLAKSFDLSQKTRSIVWANSIPKISHK